MFYQAMVVSSKRNNCIGVVIVSEFALSVVDRGFQSRSGQTRL
jgi:hypothetical protein